MFFLIRLAFFLLLGALILSFTVGSQIVDYVLSHQLSKAFGTEVTIDDVDINFADTELTVHGITVYNPKGYSENKGLTVNSAQVVFDHTTLLKPIVNLQHIKLNGINLYYIGNMNGNNIVMLQNNLAESAQNKRLPIAFLNKGLRVNHLSMTNINIHYVVEGMGVERSEQKPDFTQVNIGYGGPALTPRALLTVMLTPLWEHIHINAVKEMAVPVMESIKKAPENISKTVKVIKTQSKRTLDNITEALQEVLQ